MGQSKRKLSLKVSLNAVILWLTVQQIFSSCFIASLSLGPAEDYSKKAVKALPKEEESAKVKALKASAKGTKSIASFFAKKT